MTLLPALALVLLAAPAQDAGERRGKPAVDQIANGEFDVTLTPAEAGAVNRMTIGKTFHGDLAATSRGEMLSAGDPRAGNAGYVALETVTGTLAGRQGHFALQHSGTIDGGQQSLSIAVVPGSTGGDLAGLTGTMTIRIEGGKHFYSFHYRLP